MGGETLTLVSSTGTTLLSFSYSDAAPWPAAADGNGFSLVPQNTASPGDPGVFSTWRPSTNAGGSPGADDPAYDFHGRVIINETLTHSNLPLVDYIELYNPGTSPVDISGWYLTDDRNTPKKFKIPAGTVLNANQYLVYTETNFNPSPGAASSFSLSSQGESVYVFAADANGNLTGYSHGFRLWRVRARRVIWAVTRSAPATITSSRKSPERPARPTRCPKSARSSSTKSCIIRPRAVTHMLNC